MISYQKPPFQTTISNQGFSRRLVSSLALPSPPELRAVDAAAVRQTPHGSAVRVREDFAVDAGAMRRQGGDFGGRMDG